MNCKDIDECDCEEQDEYLLEDLIVTRSNLIDERWRKIRLSIYQVMDKYLQEDVVGEYHG